MTTVSAAKLRAYRAGTFRTAPGRCLKTRREALAFVRRRGFVFFWTIQGIDFPSLWTAAAGDRPVSDQHDDPAHVTWRWKDSLLGERLWYYGKLLRGKSTMVSLEDLPHFYALSDRVGDLDDYLLGYDAGRLTREARQIADVLVAEGAQHTVALRRLAHLSSDGSKSRFDKAITDLQRGLWVVPIGVAEAGAWRYAFIYELFERWFPNVIDVARTLTRTEAEDHVARRWLDSVGAAPPRQLQRLFGWSRDKAEAALGRLGQSGAAVALDDGRWATGKLIHR
ncbi:MAG: winged helix DNA-binding domain-containing protein [Actinobacteria bacterium]|nr:winged helix DNA-binding domain-containing protein [Actinomycetota bacterium]